VASQAKRGKLALLVVDFFNPQPDETDAPFTAATLRAAARTAELKKRLERRSVPTIYANDNFGCWESEFSSLVARCCDLPGIPGKVALMLRPRHGDRSILKPRHSAFFETPLHFLLQTLGVERIVVTGLTADSCITFTAYDAHVRGFKVWVPSDCVAASTAARTRAALAQLHRVLDASIAASNASFPRRA
jgi:nicotinamidase-related amidase